MSRGWLYFNAIALSATSAASVNSRQDAARPLTPVEIAVKDAYAREFDALIERPAIHNDPTGGGCKRMEPHLTTTAYLRTSPTNSRLLVVYMTLDGATVVRKWTVASAVTPAGSFRVLAMIVKHSATVRNIDLANWEAAQAKINQDHAAFSASRGLRKPIVSFENTNVLIDAAEMPTSDGRVPVGNLIDAVRHAAERRSIDSASYQFIVLINLDPARSEGGFAGPDGFIYMGNYSKWSRPLTAAEWINVANAVYHHETAHHWGWAHDWAPRCGPPSSDRSPFVASPVLFGWDDVDGDRIPEILDPTPYGNARP